MTIHTPPHEGAPALSKNPADGFRLIGGDPDHATLSTSIRFALGDKADAKTWNSAEQSIGGFINTYFTAHHFGEKDGTGITQGDLAGPSRTARNVVANYTLMIDSDSGTRIADVIKRVEELGALAIIATTHSHLKGATAIKEAELIKLARAAGVTLNSDTALDLCKRYLADVKRMLPHIVESASSVTKDHRAGGVQYIITHAPVERFRVVLFLDRPFVFGDGEHGSQDEAIATWRATYRAVGDALGVVFDESCADPSRFMYLPRVDAETPHGFGPGGHEIICVNGGLFDLAPYIKRNDHAAKLGANFIAAAASAGVAANDQRTFKVARMGKFLAVAADSFNAADWVRDTFPDDVLTSGLDKVSVRCPFADQHTEDKEGDTAFYAENASATLNGFAMHCLHTTCKTHNNDRAAYLEKLCEAAGIKDAIELVDHCAPDDQGDIMRAMGARPKVDVADVLAVADNEGAQAALALLVTIPADNPAHSEAENALRDHLGWSRGDMRSAKAAARRRVRQSNSDRAPLPPNSIPANMGHNEACARTAALFKAQQAADPRCFSYPYGGACILRHADGLPMFIPSKNTPTDWVRFLLAAGVQFVVPGGDDNAQGWVTIEPPRGVLKYLGGGGGEQLPILRAVINAPAYVLTPSGTPKLIIRPGYDQQTGVYLNTAPGVEFEAPPETITQQMARDAFDRVAAIFADFPFSDAFEGADPLPVKTGEFDADGYAIQNMERGRGSRANALALMFHAFARPLMGAGPVAAPLYAVMKPEKGTGASLLVQAANIVAEGFKIAPLPYSADAEEFRKQFTAVLRSGQSPIVMWDNVKPGLPFGGPVLEAAVTAGAHRDRVLGVSETVSINVHAALAVTGNALCFTPDMMRRLVPIRIDAACEHPELDRPASFYRIADLEAHCLRERGAIIRDILTVIKFWVDTGARPGSLRFTSFDAWAGVMSGIFEAVGYHDLMSNAGAFRSFDDPKRSSFGAMIDRAWHAFGGEEFTAAELYDALARGDAPDNAHTSAASFAGVPSVDGLGEGMPDLGDGPTHVKKTRLGLVLAKDVLGKTFGVEDGPTVTVTRRTLRGKSLYKLAPAGGGLDGQK